MINPQSRHADTGSDANDYLIIIPVPTIAVFAAINRLGRVIFE